MTERKEANKELTEHVMVRLTPELLAWLKWDAVENERTMAQTVRLALRQFLARP